MNAPDGTCTSARLAATRAEAALYGEANDLLAADRDVACRALADIALAVANLRDEIAANPGLPAGDAVDRIANFLPLPARSVTTRGQGR